LTCISNSEGGRAAHGADRSPDGRPPDLCTGQSSNSADENTTAAADAQKHGVFAGQTVIAAAAASARSLARRGGRAGLTAIAAARGVLGPRKFDSAVYQWLRAASTVKSSPSPFSVS